MACSPLLHTRSCSIFLQLLSNCIKECCINQSRNRNVHPLLERNIVMRIGMFGLQRSASLGSQARSQRFNGGFAKGCFTLVRRVFEHATNGGTIPNGFAGSCLFFRRFQAATNLTNGTAISSHPLKDLANHPRFFPDHLKAGLSISVLFADITIAIGCPREDTHLANLRSMPFAAPTPLQDFCSLILSNHPLNLEQKVIFRRLPDFPIEKDYLDSRSQELFQQKYLMSVVTCQSIRTMHIELINASRCCHITQPFERRANERCATVTIIDKFQLRRKRDI